MASTPEKNKSLESWIWDAACSIHGAKDAAKYKDYILPLIFTKRLCDVFDDELNCIAKEVGSRKKAFQLVKADHKLVRFNLPLVPDDPEQPVWSVKIGLAQQHFNVGAVKNTQMPLPPSDQQDEIVSHLELIDAKHNLETSKRNALQDLFRTLLHELMTARNRVDIC